MSAPIYMNSSGTSSLNIGVAGGYTPYQQCATWNGSYINPGGDEINIAIIGETTPGPASGTPFIRLNDNSGCASGQGPYIIPGEAEAWLHGNGYTGTVNIYVEVKDTFGLSGFSNTLTYNVQSDPVVPVVSYQWQLKYSSTNCVDLCAQLSTIPAVPYFTPGTGLIGGQASSVLFTDSNLTNFAPAGYYYIVATPSTGSGLCNTTGALNKIVRILSPGLPVQVGSFPSSMSCMDCNTSFCQPAASTTWELSNPGPSSTFFTDQICGVPLPNNGFVISGSSFGTSTTTKVWANTQRTIPYNGNNQFFVARSTSGSDGCRKWIQIGTNGSIVSSQESSTSTKCPKIRSYVTSAIGTQTTSSGACQQSNVSGAFQVVYQPGTSFSFVAGGANATRLYANASSNTPLASFTYGSYVIPNTFTDCDTSNTTNVLPKQWIQISSGTATVGALGNC